MSPEELKRAEAIYHSALEQSPESRAVFVARACAEDRGLRDEILSLLAARDRAGGFLAAPAAQEAAERLAAQDSFANQPTTPRAVRIGHTLNQYRILAAIGKGGMGEVYLAEDTRLHRRVALKLLPAEFQADPMRVRRFEQEARAVSALNHPNIVTLYDVGRCEDEYFMATEFVEGQTLRECLHERGCLPADEVCDITAQIAAALRAAHEAGIVHRDIKPENVMLRRDGYVKVLDFGLAKLSKDRLPAAPESSLTDAGTVMGTVSYLSPEQARGIPVDARTDVFSLGVVCYEMLAGRLPLAGQTANDVIASILRSDPPLLADAGLNRAVMKALAKDREARCQTATDFAAEIKQLSEEIAFQARLADSSGKARRGGRASDEQAAKVESYETVLMESAATGFWQRRAMGVKLLVGALALMLALLAGWKYLRQDKLPANAFSNWHRQYVESWKAGLEQGTQVLSVSPNGKMVAFSKTQDGKTDIYVKQLKGGVINRTDDKWEDFSPIWSPDGDYLAYISIHDGKTEVWRIPYHSGAGEMIGSLDRKPKWLTRWSGDGAKIYFESDQNLYALEIASRTVRSVTSFPTANSSKSDFALSADEKWIAYSEVVGKAVHILAQELPAGTPIQVTREGISNTVPLWHPDGKRLIYSFKRDASSTSQIYVADLERGTSNEVISSSQESLAPWEISADGRQIYYFLIHDQADLFLVDTDVARPPELPFSTEILQELSPNFAPDGQTIAFQRIADATDFYEGAIFSRSRDRGEQRELTARGFDPRWSPRGDQLAFLRREEQNWELWTVRHDGARGQRVADLVSLIGGFTYHPYGWANASNFTWSPDGERLAYNSKRSNVINLYTNTPDGAGERPISANTDPSLKLFNPVWSPDGKRLACLGRQSNQDIVFVFEAGAGKEVVRKPTFLRLLGWSADSQQLFIGLNEGKKNNEPATVKLLQLSLESRAEKLITELPSTYLPSLLLAPTGKQIAFVSRQNEQDNIWLISPDARQPRQLTMNTSPNVNLSGLAWSPKQNLLCYIKQSNAASIWMIENSK